MPNAYHGDPSAAPCLISLESAVYGLKSELRYLEQWRVFPAASTERLPRNLSVSACCPQQLRCKHAWSLADFRLNRAIGTGQRSVVYHAGHIQSGAAVALKVYDKSMLSDVTRQQVQREIHIQGRLAHDHICQLFGAFEDSRSVVLILEYAARGDLFRHVSRTGLMAEAALVHTVLLPVLLALDYLHAQGVLYRDLKPENVLLVDGVAKLADFGAAIDARSERPVSRLGTLDYMPPEVLRCSDKAHPEQGEERAELAYSFSADVWALGALVHELLLGASPFTRACAASTIQGIMEDEVSIPSGRVSRGAEDFIRQCLQKDPRMRPSTAQLLKHLWLKDAGTCNSGMPAQHAENGCSQDSCCTSEPRICVPPSPRQRQLRAKKPASAAVRDGRPPRKASGTQRERELHGPPPLSVFREC